MQTIEVIGVDWCSRDHNTDHLFNTLRVNKLTFVSDAVREHIQTIKVKLPFAQRTSTCIRCCVFEEAERLFVLYFVPVYVTY